MPLNALQAALQTRYATAVPAGYSLDDLRTMEVRAIVSAAEPSLFEQAVLAGVDSAAPAMINSDGKPTIMQVVAWMCHADTVNKNGDVFVASELEAITPGLFKAPNLGVMDWNHSAILQYGGDPALIGVWYNATYEKDPAANQFGIKVTGMMFSWLFPDQANEMLADQVRDGYVKFSMACIPASVEIKDSAFVLHNPVFFTNSALNRANADPLANGIVSEDPNKVPMLPAATAVRADDLDTDAESANPRRRRLAPPGDKEVPPTKEKKHMEELEKAQAELAAANRTITELAASNAEAATKVAELTIANVAAIARAEAAEALVAAGTTTAAELATAKDALVAELDTAKVTIEAQLATIAALTAEVETFKAVEAEKAKAATLVARLAEMPETYLAAHQKRVVEIRAKIEASWASLSEDEWTLKKEELFGGLTLSPTKVGFVARSALEGPLLSGDSTVTTTKAKLTALIKR